MLTTGIDVLDRIVERRRERLAEARIEGSPSPAAGSTAPRTQANSRFLAALAAHRGRAVIAEVKMGSPKLGSLVGTFDPVEQARTYAQNGAAALSVVVEPDFFHGSYELLQTCQEASGLPAIAKDFVVDPLQFQWARESGASAILLIAALYTADEMADLAQQARAHGLVPLPRVPRLRRSEWCQEDNHPQLGSQQLNSRGDTCAFTGRRGDVEGTCKAPPEGRGDEGTLACAPNHPPPRRGR